MNRINDEQNKTRGMDTWNRWTDLREEGLGGLEEISQRTYTRVCKAHGHRQQCGERPGVDGQGLGGRVRGGKWDISSSVDNKKIKMRNIFK